MTEAKTKVTITLEGDERERFDVIKNHISEKVPGLYANLQDVVRHALYLAADHLKIMPGLTPDKHTDKNEYFAK